MKLSLKGLSWELVQDACTILSGNERKAAVYVGCGEGTVDMYRGNCKIEDYVIERRPLYTKAVNLTENGALIDLGGEISMEISISNGLAQIRFESKNPSINRFWLRVDADANEHCYGCGEQMSYFDLRGRHFPLWTGEPGVGRDKTTYVTWRNDVENGGAGGDYYNTYYPQPTYVSSKHYYLHADSTAYADFDFRNKEFHELQFWEVPGYVRIEAAEDYVTLLEHMSAYFGRQPELPDWIYTGLIAGLQGGTERVEGLLERTLSNEIKVAGIWCQDWCGKRITSFGKRLQWDWHYNEEMYPDLPAEIESLHKKGIRFLGYINPYLVKDGMLYKEGLERDVFAKRKDGSVYLVDFGEFDCAIPDLTDPEAYAWFKNEVIKKCSLDIGIDGWMADFGEYLPVDDIVLANGASAMIEHNHWPALWAKCNYEAVKESGKLGEVVYFMRAGSIGNQRYCTLMWAGDQSVDFSRHDGLGTVICGALSVGMCGCGLSHSDIGGYTSMFGAIRTKELFLRWAEMAVFSPVMRTHECNRPDENFQYYDDDDCMKQLARLVDIYTMLSPYTKALVRENASKGTPVQRPMFLHYEDDEICYCLQFQYLFGRDMVVAPVVSSGKEEQELYLPDDCWIHLWTGKEYKKGMVTVPVPMGQPAVFYRKGSPFESLFAEIGSKYGQHPV